MKFFVIRKLYMMHWNMDHQEMMKMSPLPYLVTGGNLKVLAIAAYKEALSSPLEETTVAVEQ